MKRNKWKEYLFWTLAVYFMIAECRDFFYVRTFTSFDLVHYLMLPAIALFALCWAFTD